MALTEAAARRQIEGTPRGQVRYVYLRDAWPEAEQCESHAHAFVEAPADAVIAALARDLKTYDGVLEDYRRRAKRAESELAEFKAAVALIVRLVREATS